MIVYVPEPLELYQPPQTNTITVKLSSGGHVIAEPFELNKLRIISISSTDPMDYLNSKLQPGNVISMQVHID